MKDRRGENVIELYIMAASIFLLALLLIVLPFRLTWKGKLIVFLHATMLSLFTFISIPMFSYWVVFPMIMLLTGLVSFLLIKNVEMFASAPSHNKKQADHSTEPLFSYQELKEKAQLADTIDDYYIDSTQLVKSDREERMTTSDREKEVLHQAVGQDEIDRIIKKQLEETAVAVESVNERELEIGDLESIASSTSIDLDKIEMVQLEESTLMDEIEKNHTLMNQLEEIEMSPNNHLNEVEVLTDNFEGDPFKEFEQEVIVEDLSLPQDRQGDESSIAPPIPEVSFDEIDYKQRELANSIDMIEDSNEEPNLTVSEDEVDLIEIRKKLFEQFEGITTNEPILDPTETEAEIEKKEEPIRVETNPFSSRELENAFDDLEELYLKKKASKQEVGNE